MWVSPPNLLASVADGAALNLPAARHTKRDRTPRTRPRRACCWPGEGGGEAGGRGAGARGWAEPLSTAPPHLQYRRPAVPRRPRPAQPRCGVGSAATRTLRPFFCLFLVVWPSFRAIEINAAKGCGVVWCGELSGGAHWCGVVWCVVVWCDVVWCGVLWCGVVWCSVVWCGVVWCGMVWRGVVWRGVV